jgi:hypothetical protein
MKRARARAFLLALFGSLAIVLPIGIAVTPAMAYPASTMNLTNDPQISAHGNGLGAQYTTTLQGNATYVAMHVLGTACGGLTVVELNNANGYAMRVPSGATTINLSSTHDARAEFLRHPASSSGYTFQWFGSGCGDSRSISIPTNQINQGMVISSGGWTNFHVG